MASSFNGNHFSTPYWQDTLAHEFCHALLNLPDEYIDPDLTNIRFNCDLCMMGPSSWIDGSRFTELCTPEYHNRELGHTSCWESLYTLFSHRIWMDFNNDGANEDFEVLGRIDLDGDGNIDTIEGYLTEDQNIYPMVSGSEMLMFDFT